MLRHSWLLAALALAACGGDDTGSEQTATTAAPAERSVPSDATGAGGESARAAQNDAAVSAGSALGTSAAQSAPAAAQSGSPTSGRFELGKHYTRLSPTQPTSSSPQQVEVAEIFWYGCQHCFSFDPHLASWQNRKADYINFVRIPAVWNDDLKLHARAFYTAEALGKGGEMHEPLFREIHVNKNYLLTEGALRDFFGKFNVSADSFRSTFDSFAVHTKLQRADELNRRYRIGSVPTIVVNGKYSTDVSLAGGSEELLDLIDELAAAEQAGK